MNKKIKGMLLALGSAFMYGVNSVLNKLIISESGIAGALALRTGLVLVIIFLLCCMTGRKLRISPEMHKKVFLAGLCGSFATSFLLLNAYRSIPAGTATTIHFFYPAAICIINALLFREKISGKTWMALCGASVGLLFLFEGMEGGKTQDLLFVISSILSWSFYLIYFSRSGLTKEDPISAAFYAHAVVLFAAIICGLLTDTLEVTFTVRDLVLIVLTAFFETGACIFVILAVGYVGSETTAVLSVFEPISSIILEAVTLGESLSARKIAACTIILVNIALLAFLSGKTEQQKSSQNY